MSGNRIAATTRTRYARKANGKPSKLKIGGKPLPQTARKVPGATLRFNDLERFLRDRYGRRLPDDDAGRADAEIVLNHIAYRQAVDRMWLMNDWLDSRAPFICGEERQAMIRRVFRNPIRYTADVLAQKLGLTYARRQRLKITTIGAIDMPLERRKELRKAKDREYQRQKRRDAGRMTRDEFEKTSRLALKPWEAEGVSRRTWYRLKKNVPERAGEHYAADTPVPRISHAIVTVSFS